jgi:membrane associated rhomboid family serine protease
MLSDRSYMRSDYPRQTTSALTWILCATVAGAVLQIAFRNWGGDAFARMTALSPAGLAHGRVWTLVTYVLLHGGLLHLLFNCLGIFFLGREVVPLLGHARFIQFYLGSAAFGALVWLAFHAWSGAAPLVGASACIAAMFILFACVYPEREITFLLFFVLPVTVKPKYLAWALLGFDLLGLLASELPGSQFDTGIAHSAHLGGMLAGWLYFRVVYARHGFDRVSGTSLLRLPAWLKRGPSPAAAAPTPPAEAASRPPGTVDLRAEVDRILDKINSHGFGALTADEKRLLDEAKDLLSRR